MSDDKSSGATNLTALKENLSEEFEKMSQMLQEERSSFEEQIAHRKKEFDSEINGKIAELTAEKAEIDKEKSQFLKEKVEFTKEIEKKSLDLDRMKEELEQKLASENELKSLKQTYKKEEDLHFQKMAALKKELEELEGQIEQKLFFIADQKAPDYTKKSRELIITTVTGDTYRGKINIGAKERLSDMFTKVKTPFIVMYDAVFKGDKKTTVIINKHNIVSIKPLDNYKTPLRSDCEGEQL